MPKNKKIILLVAALLLVGALSTLFFSGLSENSVYFITVAEARALPKEKLENVRLFGTVHTDGIQREGQRVQFYLHDSHNKNDMILVTYDGILPDAFKSGADVIVEGGLTPLPVAQASAFETTGAFPGQVFTASLLMTQCPSKYEKMGGKHPTTFEAVPSPAGTQKDS